MMKAGIVIDSWKLDIFKRHLEAAKYKYEQKPGIVAGTLTLMVVADSAAALKPIVEAAQQECASKRHG